MRFMVIVKATKDSEAGVMPGRELIESMGRYNQQLIDAGVLKDGAGLRSSAKGARVYISGETRSVVDGPFAETKELISGYWIFDVASKEEAVEWVKRAPNPHPGADTHIEIRQMFEEADFQ